jgi:hypothetical protein
MGIIGNALQGSKNVARDANDVKIRRNISKIPYTTGSFLYPASGKRLGSLLLPSSFEAIFLFGDLATG